MYHRDAHELSADTFNPVFLIPKSALSVPCHFYLFIEGHPQQSILQEANEIKLYDKLLFHLQYLSLTTASGIQVQILSGSPVKLPVGNTGLLLPPHELPYPHSKIKLHLLRHFPH